MQLKKWKDDLQENLEQFVVAELTCSRFVRGEVGVTLLTDCESNTDFFRVCNPSAPITLSFEYTAEEVDALPEHVKDRVKKLLPVKDGIHHIPARGLVCSGKIIQCKR